MLRQAQRPGSWADRYHQPRPKRNSNYSLPRSHLTLSALNVGDTAMVQSGINQVDGLPAVIQFHAFAPANSCNSTCRLDGECPASLFCNLEDARTGHLPAIEQSEWYSMSPRNSGLHQHPLPLPANSRRAGTGGDTDLMLQSIANPIADCGINLRCYDFGDTLNGVALATNPASESCANVTDQSELACNEYCSDTGECAGDLTCWYNRCRDPRRMSCASCTPADGDSTLMQNNCKWKLLKLRLRR